MNTNLQIISQMNSSTYTINLLAGIASMQQLIIVESVIICWLVMVVILLSLTFLVGIQSGQND